MNFARPSYQEGELAELMLGTIKGYDMCKFGKNGSDATTAAVKLARAYTKRNKVAICDKTFFSINDWYIGATSMSAGIPLVVRELTLQFKYNDLESLKKLFDENQEQIACIIMEVARDEKPAPGFLEGVRRLCSENNTILIFDEIVTGFRYNLHGAQSMYGVKADLTTFGKSMANGFSISALLGKEKLMELGGLSHNKEKVFLLYQTYGGETHHFAAARTSIQASRELGVSDQVWRIGGKIKQELNRLSAELGLAKNIFVTGFPCTPTINTMVDGEHSNELATLFAEKVLEKDRVVLTSALGPSFTHTEEDVNRTITAVEYGMKFCQKALEEKTVKQFLCGPVIKSSIRKFNF